MSFQERRREEAPHDSIALTTSGHSVEGSLRDRVQISDRLAHGSMDAANDDDARWIHSSAAIRSNAAHRPRRALVFVHSDRDMKVASVRDRSVASGGAEAIPVSWWSL